MGNVLSMNEFMDFYQAVNSRLFSIEEYFAVLKEQFSVLAPRLQVGKGVYAFSSPATIYEPGGLDDTRIFYEEGQNTADTYMAKKFSTPGDGTVEIRIYPLKDTPWTQEQRATIELLVSVIFYAASRCRMSELLRRASIMDGVTGALNTDGLRLMGEELFSRHLLKEYVGIFANIKNFRYLNQRIGSKQGDEVLKKYTKAVLSKLHGDEVFARLGADNFMMLVHKENVDKYVELFSKCRVSIPLQRGSQEIEITIRMGVCTIGEEDRVTDVIHKTSIAFGIAKNPSSPDAVWFQSNMLEKTIHDKEVSNRFEEAIKKKEFVVYYQPKVTLENKHLCSSEALSRWIRDGKVVPPMEFIPILEREGSICELDFYVLDTVCRNLRDWLDRGIEPVPVSVNFSKIHLHNRDLAERILAVLHKYDIDSQYIEIELTEMSGYEDFTSLNEFIEIMKNAGVQTSIDDFGTGYSSLNLLKDLDVDIIKLDKSFINNLEKGGANDRKVVRSIVNMVNELDMQVVAEGVETNEQVEFLRKVNCSMAQGFLFDKPLPREEFEWRLLGERMY